MRFTQIRACLLAPVVLPITVACANDSTPMETATWSLGVETSTALITATATPLSAELSLRCPDGAVAAGYGGRHGNIIDQLFLICARLETNGALTGVANSAILGTSTGGTAILRPCPLDGAVNTVLVRDIGYQDGHIHQVTGRCHRLPDIAAGTMNSAATLDTGPMGGGPFGDSEEHDVSCPAGSAITGIRGRYQTTTGYVAALGYFCRPVTRT